MKDSDIVKPRGSFTPSNASRSDKPRTSGLRPRADRMADPRLIAAMAMHDISEVFKKYSTLSHGLHSSNLLTIAHTASQMLLTYPGEYLELMKIKSDEEFDRQASEAFLQGFKKNVEYFGNVSAEEIVGIFTPWVKSNTKSRSLFTSTPTPEQIHQEEKGDAQVNPNADAQDDVNADLRAASQVDTQRKALTNSQTEARTEARTESRTESRTEAQTEAQTKAQTEAQTKAQTEAKTDLQKPQIATQKDAPTVEQDIVLTEAQTDAQIESRTELPTEPLTDSQRDPQTNVQNIVQTDGHTTVRNQSVSFDEKEW